jgi:hypothetical protein
MEPMDPEAQEVVLLATHRPGLLRLRLAAQEQEALLLATHRPGLLRLRLAAQAALLLLLILATRRPDSWRLRLAAVLFPVSEQPC